MELNELVGQNIQDARKRAGFTQRDVAAKLDVSTIALSRWETGRRQPSFRRLQELSRIINKPVNEFFKEKKQRHPRAYKKYSYKRLERGKMASAYQIIEMGKENSNPFPDLEISIDPGRVTKALDMAFRQGYKDMAETLHEVTKGVLDE